MIRHGALAAILVALVWGLPTGPSATLSPGEAGLTQPETDLARLRSIRERLERHRALQRQLDRQHAAMHERIAALQSRREHAARQLEGAHDELARLERELDRLVPRLLVRAGREAERRHASARALANIASLSRRAEIEPELRARLLAVSPVMLQRLQQRETALVALEQRGERLIRRHRELSDAAPALLAARLQAEVERQQVARQEAAIERRRRAVAAELAELGEVEERLARRMLTTERARRVLVGVTPERAARAPLSEHRAGLAPREAVVAKRRVRGPLPSPTGFAQSAGSAVVAAAPFDGGPAHRLEAGPGVEHAAWSPPPAKPPAESSLVQHVRIAADPDQAVFGAAQSPEAAVGRPARMQRPSRPLLPAPDALLDPVLQAVEQRPVITMPARPGQRVAAPDAGRVAFAGRFGNYGLLLILEHEREYHTILWGFAELRVSADERVDAGEIIGTMGGVGNPELHVEFRRNGRPVGALPWLAASSSKVRG